MKIAIYGPHPDGKAIAELLKHIPEGSVEATIQAPPRRPLYFKACQRPGHLEYAMSIDNKVFVHLSQPTETANYEVKIT